MELLVIASVLLCQVLGDSVLIKDLSPKIRNAAKDCSNITRVIQSRPWLVSIVANNSHFCTGSIISKDAVLTSSFCTNHYTPANLIVWTGNFTTNVSSSIHQVVRMTSRGSNISRSNILELALMKVTPHFKFDSEVDFARLPSKNYAVTSDTVANANLLIFNYTQCTKIYKASMDTWVSLNDPICAGEKNDTFTKSCRGHFGDPLVVNGTQIGVRSFPSDCQQMHCPKFYFNVSHNIDWIYEQLQIFDTPTETEFSRDSWQASLVYFYLNILSRLVKH